MTCLYAWKFRKGEDLKTYGYVNERMPKGLEAKKITIIYKYLVSRKEEIRERGYLLFLYSNKSLFLQGSALHVKIVIHLHLRDEAILKQVDKPQGALLG